MSLHSCSKCFMNFLSSCTNCCFIKNYINILIILVPLLLQNDHPQPEGNWVDNDLHLIVKKTFDLHVLFIILVDEL